MPNVCPFVYTVPLFGVAPSGGATTLFMTKYLLAALPVNEPETVLFAGVSTNAVGVVGVVQGAKAGVAILPVYGLIWL